jgi:hypothetical protein
MSNVTTDFIAATKKIHADVRAVLASLRLIREDVKVIRENTAEKADEQPAEQEAGNPHCPSPRPNGINVTDERHSNSQQTEGNSKAQRSFQEIKNNLWEDLKKPKTYIEILALIFLILYTCETKRTNDLTSTAVQNAKDQFRVDQRPYVWPGLLLTAEIKMGEKLRVNAYFVNYGKTPAIKQRNAGKVIVTEKGKSINQQIDEFFSLIDKNGIKGDESILPPGIPQNAKESQSFVSCESDIIPITDTAVNFFKDTDGSFAVVGSSIYQDSYGTTYRTDYCSAHLNKTLLAWCSTHNEIH